MNRSRALLRCLLTVVLAVSSSVGCASAAHLRYAPRAIEQGLDLPGRDGPVARALVAVAQAAPDERQLRLRLRIENLSDEPLTLLPGAIELLSAALDSFGPARVDPDDALVVPADKSRTFELTFPYPAGFAPASAAGASLSLRWGLEWNGRQLPASTEFRRQESSDDHGGWWPPTWFSVGVGVHL